MTNFFPFEYSISLKKKILIDNSVNFFNALYININELIVEEKIVNYHFQLYDFIKSNSKSEITVNLIISNNKAFSSHWKNEIEKRLFKKIDSKSKVKELSPLKYKEGYLINRCSGRRGALLFKEIGFLDSKFILKILSKNSSFSDLNFRFLLTTNILVHYWKNLGLDLYTFSKNIEEIIELLVNRKVTGKSNALKISRLKAEEILFQYSIITKENIIRPYHENQTFLKYDIENHFKLNNSTFKELSIYLKREIPAENMLWMAYNNFLHLFVLRLGIPLNLECIILCILKKLTEEIILKSKYNDSII